MSEGRPAVVTDFGMQCPPVLLDRVAHSSAASYPFKEDYLQWLLDTTPELLPVRDFLPTALSVASLGREIPVDVGKKFGYIDNLFVTNDAHLVLVETKLYRNPEGIREVVAQTYQYGEAINNMTYLQLEGALRKGQKGGSELKIGETIASRVHGLASTNHLIGVIDDFEERLSTNIRRGEMLYLIVADGIHASVERMTFWLNEIAGSAPYRFGLIELRSYMTGNGGAVVVPRSLLRTKEISRHVVVIESRGVDAGISATVEDRSGAESGAIAITSRAVPTQGSSLTKDRLLADLRARSLKAYEIASALIGAFEAAAFDSRATSTELQYGFTFPADEGELLPMVSLSTSGVVPYLRARVISAVGDVGFAQFKRALQAIAPFFLVSEILTPKKQWGHTQKYEDLDGKTEGIVDAMVEMRSVAVEALARKPGA